MAQPGDAWARGIGLLLGLTIAAAAVLAWRIPPGTGTLGADLIVSSGPTGELALKPMGPFVSAVGLRPGPEGDAPHGTLAVYNQTGVTLGVHVRGLPSDDELNELLWVEVDVDRNAIFRGTLGDFRSYTTQAIVIRSGEERTVSLKAWLPSSITTGYEGRIENVDLQFHSVPIGT